MTALILNSGMGTRMGELTASAPKCMTALTDGETIVSRQLRQLRQAGIRRVVMTVGAFADVLRSHLAASAPDMEIIFAGNPDYAQTNYIYSIYCAREFLRDDDILLLHGDLVFEDAVLGIVTGQQQSVMTVSRTAPLPQKDFKAVLEDGRIRAVGVEFFENAAAAQPMYRFRSEDWKIWLEEIIRFCESGDLSQRRCYAEAALNHVLYRMTLRAQDVGKLLCAEVDTPSDLESVRAQLSSLQPRSVYMCFSTDILHSGHIAMIRRASSLGRLTVGVLSDEAVSGYKRLPLLPCSERRIMFEHITGVADVVVQETLSYAENLLRYRPDLVVHGDDWSSGVQQPIRKEAADVAASYGGLLVEFPYSADAKYADFEIRARLEPASPDLRRGRLRRLLAMQQPVKVLEAHSGLTGLIAEQAQVYENGTVRQFDAMWISSLCDSTARGKPDIELVDISSRMRTVDEIMEVTTKPVIFDGDTGGMTEHFVYTVRTLERTGVSMVIIEDKTGLKKNSLFGTEVQQTQADIAEFCEKLRAGKRAQRTPEFMICARIESLILGKGAEDALTRADAYTEAGADAILIHSRSADPAEVFAFADAFCQKHPDIPLAAVPTAYPSVTEEQLFAHGIRIVIYANQLTRSGVPAMQRTAESILRCHRAEECDAFCMPFREIIRLIPEET